MTKQQKQGFSGLLKKLQQKAIRLFKRLPSTATEQERRPVHTLNNNTMTTEALEIAIPIYQRYKADRHNVQQTLFSLKDLTIVNDPHFDMRKANFATDEQFEKAKRKHNEQREIEHQKNIAQCEKRLADMDKQIIIDLAKIEV